MSRQSGSAFNFHVLFMLAIPELPVSHISTGEKMGTRYKRSDTGILQRKTIVDSSKQLI